MSKFCKICGITNPEEVKWLNRYKPDYAGFVLFYPKSKRNLTIQKAEELLALLDPSIQSVAVTVCPSRDQILAIQEAGFTTIQIHGQVEQELFQGLKMDVIKAFNGDEVETASSYEEMPEIAGFLFDGNVPGSGKTYDYRRIREVYHGRKPYIIAGGITPDNALKALEESGAYGVDVSSGVEKGEGPGKDEDKIRRFIATVRNESLFERIRHHYDHMSKGQKRLADYIVAEYDKAVFLTAEKLGSQCQVSESTAVRFALLLGYDGFPGLHEAMENLVQEKLHSYKKIDLATDRIPEEEIPSLILSSDMQRIQNTLDMLDRSAFSLAVDSLLSARSIYVVGLRNCAALAEFFGFYLKQIFHDVHVITTNSYAETFEQMMHVSERDAVVGISFPRYSMRTLKAMEFANNRNAKVISLTDNLHSPMNLYSSCNLIAESGMSSVIDSLAAPLSMMNALIMALSMRRQKEFLKNLEMTEQLWEEYQIYGRDEINFTDLHDPFFNKR